MPRLKPATQAARREHILDAAEQCFARSGFHGTTMHDICREAAVSPGALYDYFDSKELLISGIVERDRSRLQTDLQAIAEAPDLITALTRFGEKFIVEEPRYKQVLLVEIGAESTRNPAVAQIFHAVDKFVMESFAQLFDRARAEGKIRPKLDSKTLATVMMVIGDGMFWRRAVAPGFDARALMPSVMAMVTELLGPVDPNSAPVPARSRAAAHAAKEETR